MFWTARENCPACNKSLKVHPVIHDKTDEKKLKCNEITRLVKDASDVERLEQIAWRLIDITASKIDITELIPILAKHSSPDIRLAFARSLDSLVYHGYHIDKWLFALANDPEDEVASRVLWCLPAIAHFRPELVYPTFDALMNRNIDMKVKCIKMLSELPHDKLDMNPFIVRIISEPKRLLRDLAGKFMLHLSNNGINVCNAVKVSLNLSDPMEFKVACTRVVVNLLPTYFESMKDTALTLLQHDDEIIRANAIRLLPTLSSNGYFVDKFLDDFLKDNSPHVRSQLAWILPELSDSKVKANLIKLIIEKLAQDKEPEVCVELIYRLPDMKERNFDITNPLNHLTKRKELEIRIAISSQLARLSYTGMNISHLFRQYLHDPNEKVRKVLAKIFPRIGGKQNQLVFHHFSQIAKDTSKEVKNELINQLDRVITKCIDAGVSIDEIYQGLLALTEETTPHQREILSRIARKLFNSQQLDESRATLLLLTTEGFI